MGHMSSNATTTIERVDTTELLRRVDRIAPLVARRAADAERAGRLTDDVIDAIHAEGLFRMMLPIDDGGSGCSMTDAYPVIEAVARIDGATGWNVCIGAISLLMASLQLPATGRAEVLADRSALIAGGVSPTGITVRPADGGYVFDGIVPFASGSPHATWILAAGMRTSDHGPILTAGLLHPNEGQRLDTWRVAGMRATASTDIAVHNVFIPAHRTFGFAEPGHRDPLASLPLLSRLGCGLAHVALGIAAHALDLLANIAERSGFGSTQPLLDQPELQADVARALIFIGAGRAYLDQTWRSVTERVLAGEHAMPTDLAQLRLSYIAATDHAAHATDIAYRAAGSAALFEDRGLERCWRDVHAVTQHFAVSRRHLARLGRIHLGVPAGPGFI